MPMVEIIIVGSYAAARGDDADEVEAGVQEAVWEIKKGLPHRG